MDYGTLMCKSTNQVGTQKEPCIFHIIMAGREDFFLHLSHHRDVKRRILEHRPHHHGKKREDLLGYFISWWQVEKIKISYMMASREDSLTSSASSWQVKKGSFRICHIVMTGRKDPSNGFRITMEGREDSSWTFLYHHERYRRSFQTLPNQNSGQIIFFQHVPQHNGR
jgi:hypothetical protein